MWLIPYLIYLHMNAHVFVCIRHASVSNRKHQYAPIRLMYASERKYSTHFVAGKSTNPHTNTKRHRKTCLAVRSIKSVRMQPK